MNKRSAVRLTLAAAAAVAIPICALAQDFTPIGDRIVSDPAYLPLHGQFFGDTGYAYHRTNGPWFDATGAQSPPAATPSTSSTRLSPMA